MEIIVLILLILALVFSYGAFFLGYYMYIKARKKEEISPKVKRVFFILLGLSVTVFMIWGFARNFTVDLLLLS